MASRLFLSDDVRCVKLILLLVKGGTLVAKKLIMKISDKSIDDFLNDNEDKLKCARKKKHITEKQMNILFPGSSQPTDMECWDISLFSYILLNLFDDKLESHEKVAIKTLRDIRNDMSHLASFVMDEAQFLREWTRLTKVLFQLSRGLTTAEEEEINDTVDKISTITDFNAAKQQLEPFERSDGLLHEIVTEKLACHDQKFKEIYTFMDEMKAFKDEVKTHLDLKARMTVDGSSPIARDTAQAKLLNGTKTCVSDQQDQSGEQDQSVDQDKDDEVLTAIKHLFSEMRNKGVNIVKVEEGSILVTFRCPTISALKNISQYLADRMYEERMVELENALSKHVGSPVKLNISIVVETLDTALMQIEKEANKKSIVLTLKCRGSEGVKNAIDCFDNGSSTNALNSLSEALSKSVDNRIELHTTIDVDQLENDIKELKHQSHIDDQHSVQESTRPIMYPSLTGTQPTELASTEKPPFELSYTDTPPTELLLTKTQPTELSATDKPPTELPATKTLPNEFSSIETVLTELSFFETLPTELSSTVTPTTELPATDTPITALSYTEKQSTELSSTETTFTEIPSTELSLTEIPATELPHHEFTPKWTELSPRTSHRTANLKRIEEPTGIRTNSMTLLDDMRNVKLILLLVKGGTFAAKRLIQKFSTSDNKCIDDYLKENQDKLDSAWKKKHISQIQIQILFPSSTPTTNLECWDISLLSYILLNLFDDKLDSYEKVAITALRDKRNELNGHSASTSMSEVQFLGEWAHLTMVLYQLTKGLTTSEKNEINDTVSKIFKMQDFQFATSELKSFEGSDEFVHRAVTEMLKCFEQRLNDCQEMVDALKASNVKVKQQQDIMARIILRTFTRTEGDAAQAKLLKALQICVSCEQQQSDEQDQTGEQDQTDEQDQADEQNQADEQDQDDEQHQTAEKDQSHEQDQTCGDEVLTTSSLMSYMKDEGLDIVKVEKESSVLTLRYMYENENYTARIGPRNVLNAIGMMKY